MISLSKRNFPAVELWQLLWRILRVSAVDSFITISEEKHWRKAAAVDAKGN